MGIEVKLPGKKIKAFCSAAPKGCMSGEGQNPGEVVWCWGELSPL